MEMGVDIETLPAFAIVIDGKLEFYFDDDEDEENPQIPTAKTLHEFAIDHMPKSLVHNINHMPQVDDRLLSKKEFLGSVLLLTEKYDTSPLYYSLAYHYRHKFVFGESRAKNLNMAKAFGVKKYPLLVALVPKGKGEDIFTDTHDLVRYSAGTLKGDPIIKWLDGIVEKLEGKPSQKPVNAKKPRNEKKKPRRQKMEEF
jgi:hypothetical protein